MRIHANEQKRIAGGKATGKGFDEEDAGGEEGDFDDTMEEGAEFLVKTFMATPASTKES